MVARALSAEPLVWVGKRSYSIYLWHYPLLLLMNPVANINDTPWWQYILQVLVVVAVAECCYRFIETPFRKGAFGPVSYTHLSAPTSVGSIATATASGSCSAHPPR